MPKTVGQNFNLCFTMIKPPQSPPNSSSQLHNHTPPAPSSFLVTNFNSLYDPTLESTSTSNSFAHFTSGDVSESDSETGASTPDFSAAFASRRFFFSTPGSSNSIVDSSSSSSPTGKTSETEKVVAGGVIAVPKLSPDPYVDFRQSMQEMVEARDCVDVRENWDYLHELVTCYLSLNPKSTHKFIMRAFADLLISLMPTPVADGAACTQLISRVNRR